MLNVIKAHAYGNDFLFADERHVAGRKLPELSRSLCDRHTGIGADGLIVHRLTPAGAAMRLFNADGSHSEVSGNGVRCLAAIVAEERGSRPEGAGVGAASVAIETDAGVKALSLLSIDGGRWWFRAAMGKPENIRLLDLEAAGERLQVAALTVGNPQCVALGPLDAGRMHRLGPALERHAVFPAGTNVEFAQVEEPGRVRILIWERGVGPTLASGTGACAAAVASAVFGGAGRDVEVIAPGGSQRVEWTDEGLFLTGWAEVLFTAQWRG
jgi:diaminopimelate epimerase